MSCCNFQQLHSDLCVQVMRWMEQCSFIAASRVGRGAYLLTGAMDEFAFAQPTRVGDILYITAQASCHLLLLAGLAAELSHSAV